MSGTNTSGQNQSPSSGKSPPPAPPAPPAATPSPDPHLWARQQVWAIRYIKGYNEDQRRRILHNFICNYENKKTAKGAFLSTTDHRAYLFDARRCKLYRIELDDPEFGGYLWSAYGLNTSEPITRHVISSLKNGTIAQGLHREIRRFAYFDRVEKVLYISRYNGTCYRIDGDEILIVSNGTGPAVFLDDDGGKPLDDDNKLYSGNNGRLIRALVGDLQYAPTTVGGMSPKIQQTCLAVWMFTIAFPDLMPAKPLLLVEGERGSGKTVALQRIAMALHGKYMPLSVPKKEDPDFGIKILRSPISIIDDVNDPVEWLRDTLCTYLTGGGWSRRKLYSDTDEVTIKPESFLGITTNNPATFRQDQVADRCLIIRLDRREDQAGYRPADQLFDQVRLWREELVGEWLYWLNEIVAELKKGEIAETSKYRMADFAHLARVIGKVLSQPGGPPGSWMPEDIEEMLQAMQLERDALVIENDSLVELIDKWLEVLTNQGREVRGSELFKELSEIAKKSNITFYRSPKALASRLRNAGGPLGHHFQITRRPTQGGVLMYAFRRT